MGIKSDIEWTESTWNPVTGCTKISEGCMNCYAERMACRLKAMGQVNYVDGFKVRTHENTLSAPLRWRKGRIIFVNSMGDLFHDEVPLRFISSVFKVMCLASQHIFQVLTKRSENLARLCHKLPWPDNVWLGVTVESEKYKRRMEDLRRTPAKIKFVSFEPLLGPVNRVEFRDIDWAIVGGESGPRARPIEVAWVKDIRDQCLKSHVPFFFKQWGGKDRKKAGRILEGRTWDQMPSLPNEMISES
ncbi:MAG: phage Gp37/Gp68 family protein [Deltaproteobacteria bacterium]|nr:phage Gp37/Gp68 family protein [Deltaproteobacteria bacterium]